MTIAKQTLSRELRAMGYRKLSARPRHHAQTEGSGLVATGRRSYLECAENAATRRNANRPASAVALDLLYQVPESVTRGGIPKSAAI